MADLASLSNQLDAKKCTWRAIIETPKGCRNKFDYDSASNLFMLGGLLPEAMMYPFDLASFPGSYGCACSCRLPNRSPNHKHHHGAADGGRQDRSGPAPGCSIRMITWIWNQSSKTLLDQLEAFFIVDRPGRNRRLR